MKLTPEQRLFLTTRNLREGKFYMFPRWGFHIFDEKGDKAYLPTNPFTKSLDRHYFLVKELTGGKLVRGNFYEKPLAEDFYLSKEELQRRDAVEMVFVVLVCVPWFWAKNLWNKFRS